MTHQDQRLAERVGAAGCPTVVVLNKWELVATEDRTEVLADVGDRLAFLGEAPVLKVSALTGLGVHHILPAVAAAEEAYHRRIPTGELNRALESIQAAHPPVGRGSATACRGPTTRRPSPCSPTAGCQPTYLRYLERGLRERSSSGPTPIKLRVRAEGGRQGWGPAMSRRRRRFDSHGVGRAARHRARPDHRPGRGASCPGVRPAISGSKTRT